MKDTTTTRALVARLARTLEEGRVELGSLGNDPESVEGLVVEIVEALAGGESRDALAELWDRVDRSPFGSLDLVLEADSHRYPECGSTRVVRRDGEPEPRFRAVIVEELEPRFEGDSPSLSVVVRDESRSVDRWEHVTAWGLRLDARSRKLAARLKAAVEAGVVLADPEVLTDVNGKTYWSTRSEVLGRRMNADLKRLGF